MSNATTPPPWERLYRAGLVDQASAPEEQTVPVPWYVRIMTGIAGWIAATFLVALVPVGFGRTFTDGWSWLVIGSLFCLLAWFLSLKGRLSDFTEQFAFALSVAGQIQLLFGLQQLMGWDLHALGWVALGLETLLFFAITGLVHRVWTVFAAGLALLYLISGLQQNNILLALMLAAFASTWLNEFRLPRYSHYLHPLGYGLLLVVVLLVITGQVDMGGLRSSIVPGEGLVGDLQLQPLLGAALVAVVVIATTLMIGKQQSIAYRRGTGLALSGLGGLVAVTTLWAPGVGAAYLVMLIGYAHGNRGLLGLGGFGLLSYLSHYYYALELSLLHKSALLAGTGMVLLLVRMVFGRLALIAEKHAADTKGEADA